MSVVVGMMLSVSSVVFFVVVEKVLIGLGEEITIGWGEEITIARRVKIVVVDKRCWVEENEVLEYNSKS
jgi:hypothetical protein